MENENSRMKRTNPSFSPVGERDALCFLRSRYAMGGTWLEVNATAYLKPLRRCDIEAFGNFYV